MLANSNRIYRKSLSKEVIKKELEMNRGTQFDPYLLDAFIELLNDGTQDRVEKEALEYAL